MVVGHERLPEAASPVLSCRAHDAVLATFVGALLLGSAVVVDREVLATLGMIDDARG